MGSPTKLHLNGALVELTHPLTLLNITYVPQYVKEDVHLLQYLRGSFGAQVLQLFCSVQ